jgi:hypothetical protein
MTCSPLEVAPAMCAHANMSASFGGFLNVLGCTIVWGSVDGIQYNQFIKRYKGTTILSPPNLGSKEWATQRMDLP